MERRQVFEITEFKGLNLNIAPSKLPPNFALVSENVAYNKGGSCEKRKGYEKICLPRGSQIDGLHSVYSEEEGLRLLMIRNGVAELLENVPNGSFTQIGTNLGQGVPYDFENWGARFYLANLVDGVYSSLGETLEQVQHRYKHDKRKDFNRRIPKSEEDIIPINEGGEIPRSWGWSDLYLYALDIPEPEYFEVYVSIAEIRNIWGWGEVGLQMQVRPEGGEWKDAGPSKAGWGETLVFKYEVPGANQGTNHDVRFRTRTVSRPAPAGYAMIDEVLVIQTGYEPREAQEYSIERTMDIRAKYISNHGSSGTMGGRLFLGNLELEEEKIKDVEDPYAVPELPNLPFDAEEAGYDPDDLPEGFAEEGSYLYVLPEDRLYKNVNESWVEEPKVHVKRRLPSHVIFSEIADDSTWRDPETGLDNLIIFGEYDGDEITGMVSAMGELFVFKNNSIWILYGTRPDNYEVKKLIDNLGCVAPGSLDSYHGSIVFVSAFGVRMVHEGGLEEFSEVDALFQELDQGDFDKMSGVVRGDEYWLSMGDGTVLMINLRERNCTLFTNMDFAHLEKGVGTGNNERIFASQLGSEGEVYELDKGEKDPGDTPIEMKRESAYLALDHPQLRKMGRKLSIESTGNMEIKVCARSPDKNDNEKTYKVTLDRKVIGTHGQNGHKFKFSFANDEETGVRLDRLAFEYIPKNFHKPPIKGEE